MQTNEALAKADRLQTKIVKLCNGNGIFLVFAVIETVLESIVEALDSATTQRALTVRLFHMLLQLPCFDDLDTAAAVISGQTSNSDDVQNVTILRRVRALVEKSRSLSDSATGADQDELSRPFCAKHLAWGEAADGGRTDRSSLPSF